MRVLVTGAGGFLGLRLVRQLLERGCEVTAVARAHRREALEAQGCRFLEADLGRRDPIADPGPHDAAFLLAQSAAYRDGAAGAVDVLGVNLVGLARSLELVRSAGVERLFHFSSGSVYRPSFEPLREDASIHGDGLYPMSKRMGEEVVRCLADDLSLTIVRPFIVYGPEQRDRLIPDLVGRVAEGRAITLAPREPGESEPSGLITTPCHVEDAARMSAALLDAPQLDVLNLAGDERVSIRDVGEVAGKLLGREPVFEVLEAPRAGDFVADGTRLEKLLAPRILPFAEGLAEVAEAQTRGEPGRTKRGG